MRFLFRWQRLCPGTQTIGEDGLRAVVDQLQGFECAAGSLSLGFEWPDRVPSGGRNETPVIGVDIFPTFCDIAGVPYPEQPRDKGSRRATRDRWMLSVALRTRASPRASSGIARRSSDAIP